MMGQGGAVSAGEMEQLRTSSTWTSRCTCSCGCSSGRVRGDLGYSYTQKRPVSELIVERLPATIELAAGALFSPC